MATTGEGSPTTSTGVGCLGAVNAAPSPSAPETCDTQHRIPPVSSRAHERQIPAMMATTPGPSNSRRASCSVTAMTSSRSVNCAPGRCLRQKSAASARSFAACPGEAYPHRLLASSSWARSSFVLNPSPASRERPASSSPASSSSVSAGTSSTDCSTYLPEGNALISSGSRLPSKFSSTVINKGYAGDVHAASGFRSSRPRSWPRRSQRTRRHARIDPIKARRGARRTCLPVDARSLALCRGSTPAPWLSPPYPPTRGSPERDPQT